MRNEARELRAVLDRVALRLGAGAAARMIARAAVFASAGLLVWALVTLVLPLAFSLRAIAAYAGAVMAATFPVLVWWLRPSMLAAAQVADRRLSLADRLSTAVDLLGRPGPITGLARLQVLDAVERARSIVPRAIVPIRPPREAWMAALGSGLLVLWAQFLSGWSVPGTPAARTIAVIHHEGRALEEVAHRLDVMSRAGGLPETRRAVPLVEALGRRLEAPQITRQGALALLREAGRHLATAREQVERRLLDAAPNGAGAPDPHAPNKSGSGAQRLEALQEAVRQIREMTGQLRAGGASVDRADLSRRLRALSDSLDRTGAPPTARRKVASARREAEYGRLSVAADALVDGLRDLQSIERMLQDEQGVGEARREVLKSSQKIAESGPLGAGAQEASQGLSEAEAPRNSGSNLVSPGPDEGTPPPPGPNQGSLPGQGAGGTLGSPTPRLGGARVPAHLAGIPGEGTSALREITAPGHVGSAYLPATRPPAEVSHEVDRALSRGSLPPAYLTLVRRYFESLGGSP